MLFNSFYEMMKWFIIGWAIWPGTFFLAALVGESRLPPIWKRQSKAFFPGGLALPAMWIAVLKTNLVENLPVNSMTSVIAGLVAMFAIALGVGYAMRKVIRRDRSCYAKRAANSPTKIYHDLVGYYLFPMTLVLDAVVYVVRHIDNGVGIRWSLTPWFVIPLAFYALCVVYDVRHPATKEDIVARHPEDWMPIWKMVHLTLRRKKERRSDQ